MDGRVRNTQNIYKSHQFSSHNDDEEDQIETVTNLCEALENFEDDNKPITRLEDVGIKINYHLLTSIFVTSILSYTVLEDDTNDEK
ncbi:EM14S01-3B_G0025950.mRNA.1.CDS.1 [Saccharomyces cerevisiae]|nr:EM14S01-3B_G0025950.mRNA.1.CDS.1 [Saccharomyces cerevisiae]